MIAELTPLFNRRNNPKAEQIKMLLGVNYEATQNSEAIQWYLKRYSRYENIGLFGFALPVAAFVTLEKEALMAGCSCSDLLQRILEKEFGQKIPEELSREIDLETNLITTKKYGKQHKRSTEQIKQYLHQKNRIPGTAKIGRDWIVPEDARFPKDHWEI